MVLRHKPLYALIALFVAPFVLALLAYYGDWFSRYDLVSRGQWVTPTQSLNQLLEDKSYQGRWQVIFVDDKSCQPYCATLLQQLQQLHQALGKDQARVQLLHLLTTAQDGSQAEAMPTLVIQPALWPSQGSFYIADPMGNLLLSYPLPKAADLTLALRDILFDLRKLLRYSHVG